MAALEERHLSELHALAAKLEVPRYRLLGRGELVEEIRRRGGDEPEVAAEAPPDREREVERVEARVEEEAPTEEVTGILDVMPQRYGFLRLRGFEGAEGDVYISASQIRRCELRPGDEVGGPAREPRRGERHRALVHVDRVNGGEPGAERTRFEDLTPVAPRRRIPVGEAGEGDVAVLVRAVDVLVPLAFGQRVLISAAPRSGRTTLLRALARALAAAGGSELLVLLVDERPEEGTRWREELGGAKLAIATAEMTPVEQSRIAELALARGCRLAEAGYDAVLLVDSLSRLAATRDDTATVKRLFGSGRELGEEDAGSLTVIATVLDQDGDAAGDAVATTENALVGLDPTLAASGVFPALDPARCQVSDEEELRDPAELEAARRLRESLAGLEPREAAAALRERIESSASNAELLSQL
jgi:transcription termination factor Rho